MLEFRIQEKMLQSNKNRVNCLKMSVWSSEGQNLQFNVSHIAFVEGKKLERKTADSTGKSEAVYALSFVYNRIHWEEKLILVHFLI